jgi:XTP/dITP diphosphohydrolase
LIGILILNKFIIASTNSGKIAEIIRILDLDNVELTDLKTIGFNDEIDECGSTFIENALIKAETVFSKYRIPVIADDSGLSVSFLDGEPGVHSARFAGRGAGDRENNELLLEKLEGANDQQRKAWFTCVAVFYYDEGRFCHAEEKIEGVITRLPSGKNGFGYDPLFFIPGFGKTMAELSSEEKNAISHRSKAFKVLKDAIKDYLRTTA